MIIGRIGRFTIERQGRTQEEQGEGIVWSCTCPKGRIYAGYQWSRLRGAAAPPIKPRPCRHLHSVFSAAKVGLIADRLRLTEDGRRAAAKCECIERAGGLQPRPMKAPPPEPTKPSGELSRNGPCWCGSGEKLKRCEPEGSPHHDKHLAMTQPKKPEPPVGPVRPPVKPRCAQFGPNGEGPCVSREGHVERGYTLHRDDQDRYWSGKPKPRGWFKPTVEWIKEEKKRLRERAKKLDEILDRIHAQEDARREKARQRREERKAKK